MSERIHAAHTPYGFEFGVALVERACSYKGHVVIEITTPRKRVNIRVTPSGLIRIDKVYPNEAPHE